MKFRLLFLNICLLFLHFSCEEELQVPIPNDKPRLVINSLIGVDSLLRVHVSKSSGFQNENTNSPLTNANVEISQNNKKLGDMIPESNGWYSLNPHVLMTNSSYQIKVSHPDLETAKSETEVLEKVAISNLSYEVKEKKKIEFTIQFQDKASQKNYYMILLKAIDGTTISTINYYSDDIIFNDNLTENSIGIQQNMLRGSRSFSDENLDGNNISISIYVYKAKNNSTKTNQKYKLELYHITSDYFKYERSLTTYYNRDDLPFYKKVNLHSNIHGGYGIFTSYAIDSKLITLD